jgi:soluble lytic murein transglycosylase-like protein
VRVDAVSLAAFALLACGPASACWDEVAQRYGIAADLLYAIARVESDLNPQAVNRSHLERTGSYDIGLMQINSRHLARLQGHGIAEADLLEPCTNLQVGAWLMADSFARHGVNWNAVGAYNAACTQLRGDDCAKARAHYAWKVYRRLPAVQAGAAPKTRPVQNTVPAGAWQLAVRVAP